MKKFIFDLQRFAVINNTVSDTLVSGTDDDDSITNRGSNVTIEALDGDDSIYNDYCSNVSIMFRKIVKTSCVPSPNSCFSVTARSTSAPMRPFATWVRTRAVTSRKSSVTLNHSP